MAKLFGEEEKTLTMAKKGRVKSNVPRKMATYIARKYGDYRFQELADAFGLQHYGGASYAVHTFAQELRNDPGLGLSVDKIVEKLMRK